METGELREMIQLKLELSFHDFLRLAHYFDVFRERSVQVIGN